MTTIEFLQARIEALEKTLKDLAKEKDCNKIKEKLNELIK